VRRFGGRKTTVVILRLKDERTAIVKWLKDLVRSIMIIAKFSSKLPLALSFHLSQMPLSPTRSPPPHNSDIVDQIARQVGFYAFEGL
jgi:hypothetical protein